MSAPTCAYCGAELKSLAGGRRYCGAQCASNYWRLGQAESQDAAAETAAWRTMRDESPAEWDGKTEHSPSAFRKERHMATCMACSIVVEPTDPAAWRNAVRTRRCEHCHGSMRIEVQDAGVLSSPSEGRIRLGKRVA